MTFPVLPDAAVHGQRVRGSGSDTYSASLNTSEIDTDDEVEAVRRVRTKLEYLLKPIKLII